MKLDEELLHSLHERKNPLLHLYDWERPSATYGHFIKPKDFLNLQEVEKIGLDLAKRPTGGGIVFHLWDLAFSILIPASHPFFSMNTLENYAFVHRVVLSAVKKFLQSHRELELLPEDSRALDASCGRFCMARPTKYDLVVAGRKIAGAAQRKCRAGFLHQGTIALRMPDPFLLEKVLLPNTRVFEAMIANTYPLLGSKEISEHALRDARLQLRHDLQESLMEM